MITVVILAAGTSRRLGRAKQLLPFAGTTLIGHVCECGISAKCDDVIVVLGADRKPIEESISSLPLHIIENPLWSEGIASSIKTAVRHIISLPERVNGLLFLTSDQVSVSTELLDRMIESFKNSPESIVACRYGDSHGIPAMFPRRYFDELLSLSGDQGAKSLLITHRKEIISIPFPGGEIDIDTRQDYQSLLSVSAETDTMFPIHNRYIRPTYSNVAKEYNDETT